MLIPTTRKPQRTKDSPNQSTFFHVHSFVVDPFGDTSTATTLPARLSSLMTHGTRSGRLAVRQLHEAAALAKTTPHLSISNARVTKVSTGIQLFHITVFPVLFQTKGQFESLTSKVTRMVLRWCHRRHRHGRGNIVFGVHCAIRIVD